MRHIIGKFIFMLQISKPESRLRSQTALLPNLSFTTYWMCDLVQLLLTFSSSRWCYRALIKSYFAQNANFLKIISNYKIIYWNFFLTNQVRRTGLDNSFLLKESSFKQYTLFFSNRMKVSLSDTSSEEKSRTTSKATPQNTPPKVMLLENKIFRADWSKSHRNLQNISHYTVPLKYLNIFIY